MNIQNFDEPTRWCVPGRPTNRGSPLWMPWSETGFWKAVRQEWRTKQKKYTNYIQFRSVSTPEKGDFIQVCFFFLSGLRIKSSYIRAEGSSLFAVSQTLLAQGDMEELMRMLLDERRRAILRAASDGLRAVHLSSAVRFLSSLKVRLNS